MMKELARHSMSIVLKTPTTEWERAWWSYVARIRQSDDAPPFEQQWERFRSFRHAADFDAVPFAWWPDEERVTHSNLHALMSQVGVLSYSELHRWSVENKALFWEHTLTRLGVTFRSPPESILSLENGVADPHWLGGARLNIVDSCFNADADQAAILFGRERTGELERMSFGELKREVDRFAQALRRNVKPDESVVLYMPMTPECVVAYLGTVLAGARVVSVADSFSPEELRKRMEIADATIVVTVERYHRAGREIRLYEKVRRAFSGLGGNARAIVCEAESLTGNDVSWSDFLGDEGVDDALLPFIGDPQHVTNILFSSGTTGTPKAIPWTQLTPLKAAMDGHYHQDLHPKDVVCWPTNIGWMMGPWLIYASLINRACIALYEGAPMGAGFIEFVRNAEVTMLGVVPALVRHWRAHDDVPAGGWPALRLFSSTGEASNAEDYLWLMSRTDYRAPVIEYLGGTEIGGGHLTGTVLQPASPATFTTPAMGVDVVVLDEEGRPVKEGDMGELFIIPPALGLSQRLLNKDHAEVYYQGAPVGPKGQVLRRHGDQIARLPHGYFKAQGRADDTMNLGGIKVGSLELEAVINDDPLVYESAAVAVQPGGEGAEQLVVYVTLASKHVPAIDNLKAALQKRLASELNPLFKIQDIVVVPSLPRTASNKILRRRLRDEYASRRTDASDENRST